MKRAALFGIPAGLLMGLCATADAAAGWTGYGTISTLEQDGANSGSTTNEVFVVVNVTPNPSGCSASTGFYLDWGGATQADTDRKKRLFEMLLIAQSTTRQIRFYVTGACHSVGYAELDGIAM